MLPDGRALLGPYNGQLWRGTDARNTEFDALDAGPITTVLSAGARLYGLASATRKCSLRHLAWIPMDDGAAAEARIPPAAAGSPAPSGQPRLRT